MPKDFVPGNDQEFLAWADNYSSLITADPTSYNLVAANATQLAGLFSTFQSALAAATEPTTRGEHTILVKEEARRELVSYVRQTARAIQGALIVMNPQRQALGLPIRDVEPTPIPVPAMAPSIVVKSSTGNTVCIAVLDPNNTTRRGRPPGVDGIAVFSFVGAEAATEEAVWKFEGNTTRTIVNISFPASTAPGAKVWFTAFYFNQRKHSGPAAAPVSTNIAGGGAMAA